MKTTKLSAVILAVIFTFAFGWASSVSAEYFPPNKTVLFRPTMTKDGDLSLRIRNLTVVITDRNLIPSWCGTVRDADLLGDSCIIKYGPKTRWVFEGAMLYALPLPGSDFTASWNNLDKAIGKVAVKGRSVRLHIRSCGWGACVGQWNYVIVLPALSHGVERVWGWGSIPAIDNPAVRKTVTSADGRKAAYTRMDYTFRVEHVTGTTYREACRFVAYSKGEDGRIRPISTADEEAYLINFLFVDEGCGGFPSDRQGPIVVNPPVPPQPPVVGDSSAAYANGALTVNFTTDADGSAVGVVGPVKLSEIASVGFNDWVHNKEYSQSCSGDTCRHLVFSGVPAGIQLDGWVKTANGTQHWLDDTGTGWVLTNIAQSGAVWQLGN